MRPPVQRELEGWEPYQNTVQINGAQREVTLSETVHPGGPSNGTSEGLLYATYRFTFDHIFPQAAEQQHVYDVAARPAVVSTLQGYNASIIAYGQTGTGKTYTMEGNPGQEGIVSRAVQDIFGSISADSNPQNQYLVRVSYLQIYNEVISDLLKTERTNLSIRCVALTGTYLHKAPTCTCSCISKKFYCIDDSASVRVCACSGAPTLNCVQGGCQAGSLC